MNISRAGREDIEGMLVLLGQVLEVHHRGRPDIFKTGASKYTKRELEELLLDAQRPIFVAKNEERMLGYAFCVIKKTEGDNILKDMKTLYIDDLCVDENERGNGIGRALYEHVKDYAKELGCYNLTLNVWECNAGAKRFYESMGLLPRNTLMETIL